MLYFVNWYSVDCGGGKKYQNRTYKVNFLLQKSFKKSTKGYEILTQNNKIH